MAPRKKTTARSPVSIVGKEGPAVDDIHSECDRGTSEKVHSESDEYLFVLVNPKDVDSQSKLFLQELLQLYKRELPSMIYAANTGKQSTFMEKCVSNGKYCTLLMKSTSVVGPASIIAAITYQIVPADTQYAEIPLAAVRSTHHLKGFGRMLYSELRKRLQNVGIRTIFCWGDEESEGFWFKQGFVSIAEVNTKGKARRIPIRSDIRKALCFPGGSILMVSHIYQGLAMSSADLPKSRSLLKPEGHSSHALANSTDVSKQNCEGLNAVEPLTCGELNFQSKWIVTSAPSSGGNNICDPQNQDAGHGYNDPVSVAEIQNCRMAGTAELSKTIGQSDEKHCLCSRQGAKRAWEASVSSLKSKKVKGVHLSHLQSESNENFDPKSKGCDICSQACSLGTSKDDNLSSVSPKNPLTTNCSQEACGEFGVNFGSKKALIGKDRHSLAKSYKIMLMNIADEVKKAHLMKVIEDLGGSLTSDGSTSTHVITGKVRKTLNFCTALCSGAWIVSPSWLKESYRKGRFLDELPFILNDDDYELKYRASLNTAVLRARACRGALFAGYDVCISAHSQPPPRTLSPIVKSAGGNVIRGLEAVDEASKTIYLAGEEDVEEALVAVRKGIWTFNSEWLMNCVMRQELDMDAPQFAESL